MANIKLARENIRIKKDQVLKVVVYVDDVEASISPLIYTEEQNDPDEYSKREIVLRADDVVGRKTDQELLDDGVIDELPEDPEPEPEEE